MTRNEPQAVREVHEIRERLYRERKDWTDKQRRDQVERVGDEIAKKLGLRIVTHTPRRPVRKHA